MQSLNAEYHIRIFLNAATGSVKAPEDISGSLHNNLNTTDLTGEYEDRNFVVTRGDSRISMTIARNVETVKLNRKNRFLIDDESSPQPLAYLLTKPLKLGWSFNQQGVFKFVLQEVTTTDDDNIELRIADFYKHFPKTTTVDVGEGSVINTDNTSEETGRKVWL